MNEIARAAGCSRATLYRYFENREALHTAYVHRETHRFSRGIIARIVDIDDPGDADREHPRGVADGSGEPRAVVVVRREPPPIGGEMAERSDVIRALTEGFLRSLGPCRRREGRARWLVRVMISLLVFPGDDDADERAMLEEFVLPIVTPVRPARSDPVLSPARG